MGSCRSEGEESRGERGREEGLSIFTSLYCRINIQLRKSEPFFTVVEEVVETQLRAFKSSMNFRKTSRRRRKGHYYWRTKTADGDHVRADFNAWPRVGVCELSSSLTCMKEKTESSIKLPICLKKLKLCIFANWKKPLQTSCLSRKTPHTG